MTKIVFDNNTYINIEVGIDERKKRGVSNGIYSSQKGSIRWRRGDR